MAPRVFWKGDLKLSLVTCPVAMSPVISQEDKVCLRTLNGKTGNLVCSASSGISSLSLMAGTPENASSAGRTSSS